jgi:DUF917 family protein
MFKEQLMSKILLSEQIGEAVVFGGAVLGGGGGGDVASGLENARLAVRLGNPVLVSLDELDDEDLVVTASAVGAPAAKDKLVRPVDHIRAMEMVIDQYEKKIAGIIANENGAGSGVNGWIQAAALGLPMVDAPANGRAHPTGLMGAMGLHRIKDYLSIQSAVGGNPDLDRHLEMIARGRLAVTANLVRQAAVQAGGVVAVSRDPVRASYLRKNAACGATTQAMRIGQAIVAARDNGSQAVLKSITSTVGGQIACQGEVIKLQLETVGGYDIGRVELKGERSAELIFWNEFMTLDFDGQREATFPDLITLLSLQTGLPISSAELAKGDRVAVLTVPKDKLILGKGVLLPETLAEAEAAIGKSLTSS